MSDAARFLRQLLLPEIGEAGQSAIARGTARLGRTGGEGRWALVAHEVAETYARRAGFAHVEPGEVPLERLAPEAIVRSDAPRAVLAGARAALAAIRLACGLDAVARRSEVTS